MGTVSNVLNGIPTVTEKNRQKVLAAIQQLNFSPNYAARTLKTRRSRCIGLIIPDINNPFYSEFARGVEDSVQAMGYNLFLCNSDRNAAKEREYMDALLERMVDGLILFKTHMPVEEVVDFSSRFSIVLVDTGRDINIGCDIIKVDDYLGVQQALEYLWNFNHRRIAMIAGTKDSLSSLDRIRSYNDFFISKKYSLPAPGIQHGHYDWHSGYDCANIILDRENQPTAIIAANDLMAIGAIKAIQERGLSVPDDISVIGYDDIDIASLCTPTLTTIRQPKYKMGEHSVRCLLNRIESRNSGQDIAPIITTLKTEIIVRNSVSFCETNTQRRSV
ncbi:LacI family transcriptional regulator [Spirochaetia bacterium]|nr:LacI family transcriptional regulator [Spirochaetia bacterium]